MLWPAAGPAPKELETTLQHSETPGLKEGVEQIMPKSSLRVPARVLRRMKGRVPGRQAAAGLFVFLLGACGSTPNASLPVYAFGANPFPRNAAVDAPIARYTTDRREKETLVKLCNIKRPEDARPRDAIVVGAYDGNRPFDPALGEVQPGSCGKFEVDDATAIYWTPQTWVGGADVEFQCVENCRAEKPQITEGARVASPARLPQPANSIDNNCLINFAGICLPRF